MEDEYKSFIVVGLIIIILICIQIYIAHENNRIAESKEIKDFCEVELKGHYLIEGRLLKYAYCIIDHHKYQVHQTKEGEFYLR